MKDGDIFIVIISVLEEKWPTLHLNSLGFWPQMKSVTLSNVKTPPISQIWAVQFCSHPRKFTNSHNHQTLSHLTFWSVPAICCTSDSGDKSWYPPSCGFPSTVRRIISGFQNLPSRTNPPEADPAEKSALVLSGLSGCDLYASILSI